MRLAAWLLLAPAAFLAAFFAYPMVVVLREASPAAWAWLGDDYARSRILVAFQQGLASLVLTLGAAIPLAWLYHARKVPGERIQRAMHAAPFVLPVFVVVYGLQQTFGRAGLVDQATGVDVLTAIGPFGAVVLANSLYNYGFATRLLFTALEARPARLEAAARMLGASPRQAFLHVTLPLLLPAVASVAVLVFLFCFASFGVVLFLGGGQVATMETMLYQNLGGVRPRADRAAVLGIAQLAVNALLLAAYLLLRRRQIPAVRRRVRPQANAGLIAVSWALVGLAIVPAATVLIGGFQVAGEWSLGPWRSLLDAGHPEHRAGFDLGAVLVRTVIYAGGSSLGAIALCAAVLYGSRALPPERRRLAEALASLPFGASSLIVGLGLWLAFGAGAALDLRGSPWAVLVAHTLIALPFVARIVLPAAEAQDRGVEDAAILLGASPASVVWRIHLPLLAGPLAAATGFAVALSLGDFGSSLLLMRSDTAGLAYWVFHHDRAFDPFSHAQAVALAGLLAVLAAAAFALVERAPPEAR